MMRSRTVLAGLALTALAVASCDQPAPLGPEVDEGVEPRLAISDATRGGNPGFMFLPPFGPPPDQSSFDASLEPVVELCLWNGDSCEGAPLVSMDATLRAGPQFYRARVDLREAGVKPNRTYRINVRVGGVVLGYVDILAQRVRGREFRLLHRMKTELQGAEGDEDTIVEVTADRSIPVRFRIKEGAIAIPTASFQVGGTLEARSVTTFDATASGTPDGSPLVYSWDFGDGSRGGGATIAHVYASAGDYEATLQVTTPDGTMDTETRTVSVGPGPAPTGTADVIGQVRSSDGSALPGVTVAVVGGTPSGTTGGDGVVELDGVDAGVSVLLRLTRSGFAEQFVELEIPTSADEAYFEAVMQPRATAVDVDDVEAGATVEGTDGVMVDLPEAALVTADGVPVTGTVEVSLTPVDVTQPDAGAFPGGYAAVDTEGTVGELLSYGVAEFVLTQDGEELDLAPGKTAVVEIPIYTGGAAVGDEIPLWSLDEATGLWVQEAIGEVVLSDLSLTGLALRAEVGHFSWWNIDVFMDGFTPFVRCEQDGAPVSCTVRGTFQQDDSPVRSATEVVPAEGTSLPSPAGVDVLFEALAEAGTVFDQVSVNGAVGSTPEVVLELSAAYQPVITCETASGAPVACNVRGEDQTGRRVVYEEIPASGRTVNLPADTEITLRGFNLLGGAGSITIMGPSGPGGVETIMLTETYVARLRCRNHVGATTACSASWFVPGASERSTVAIPTIGRSIQFPADEPINVTVQGPQLVFQNLVVIEGPAGVTETVTVDLVGQGGEFCGGAPLSVTTVTVIPDSGCPAPGVVSTAQEAVYLVAHGGTIQFGAGEHRVIDLNTPRNDLTITSVAGEEAVIAPGSGVENEYDGPGFKLDGSGDIVVRDLTFQGLEVGRGGIGLITGQNSISGVASYGSILVDNVRFHDLRIAVVALPSSVVGASVALTGSEVSVTVVPTEQRARIGIFALARDDGSHFSLQVAGNTFSGLAGLGLFGINFANGIGVEGDPDRDMELLIADNTFHRCLTCVSLFQPTEGTEVRDNVMTSDAPLGGIGVRISDPLGAGPSIHGNAITGSLTGDRTDPFAWGIREAITVVGEGTGSVSLDANTISTVHIGIWTQGGSTVAATNMVIDDVRWALNATSTTAVTTIHESDITNFEFPFDVALSVPGSLTCNWWGDPAGPFSGDVDPRWAPWAVAPIANGAGGACTGGS